MMNLLFLSFLVSCTAFAQDLPVLSAKEILEVIGDYPTAGSYEEKQDFIVLLDWQKSRTEKQCALAAGEERASFVDMFSRNNGPLTEREAKGVAAKIEKFRRAANRSVSVGKEYFRRLRPYDFSSEIRPCIRKEGSFAYPSGHTAVARVTMRILETIYPERKASLLKRADEIAENRVIGGVHHPTDIEAGKKLGDHLAEVFLRKGLGAPVY